MRELIDRNGTRWDLFEVSTETLTMGRQDFLPPAFQTGWLVFDCGGERRRLAPFPAEWASFSSAALCALLDAATRVEPRVPRASHPARPSHAPSDDGGRQNGRSIERP